MITLPSFNVVGFPFHIRIGLCACSSSEWPLHACMLWTIGDGIWCRRRVKHKGLVCIKYDIAKLSGSVVTCLWHKVGGLLACFAVSEAASTMNFITDPCSMALLTCMGSLDWDIILYTWLYLSCSCGQEWLLCWVVRTLFRTSKVLLVVASNFMNTLA